MAVTKPQEIKNSSSFDSRAAKYSKKNKNSKDNTNSSPISKKLTVGTLAQTAALVLPLGKTKVVYLIGKDTKDIWEDALTKVELTSNPEVVPASTKPVDGVLNGLSNKLVEKSKDINMSGLEDGPEDVSASITKPANGDLNGSLNEVDKSKDINISWLEVGPEDARASIKPG